MMLLHTPHRPPAQPRVAPGCFCPLPCAEAGALLRSPEVPPVGLKLVDVDREHLV